MSAITGGSAPQPITNNERVVQARTLFQKAANRLHVDQAGHAPTKGELKSAMIFTDRAIKLLSPLTNRGEHGQSWRNASEAAIDDALHAAGEIAKAQRAATAYQTDEAPGESIKYAKIARKDVLEARNELTDTFSHP